jgi:HEAT repeat protein
VALEVANAAAALGSDAGTQYIHDVLWGEDVDAPMRMEAAFIATELGRGNQRGFATDVLTRIASEAARFRDNEVRQAALWGLGHAGVRAYDRLLPFLDDPEENVAMHAIAAFGSDTPAPVIVSLVAALRDASPRKVAACSEALRLIGSDVVIRQLIAAAGAQGAERAWVLATLGRLPAADLRAALAGTALLAELEPLLLVSSGSWLSKEDANLSLRFLSKQCL